MNSEPFTPKSQNPKANPYLTPEYLLAVSSHIETLSTFYQQQNLPSLSSEYKSFLQSTFKNLANSLNMFFDDETFLVSSLISTKVQLETYLGEKFFTLLQRQTQPLAEIIKFILLGYKQNTEHYEELLIKEKKRKVELQHEKNDQIVNNLKKEVLIKREYVKELQQRIKDLEEENSKIYQKIIDNAKNTISSTLIQSKVLNSSSEFMTPGKYSKLSVNLPQQSSPALAPKVSHKQMSLKQVEETVLQILNSKRKKESISLKRSSMKSYIRYFFKYKFGLNDLCDEMRMNFLSAVRHFLSSRNENQTSSSGSLGSNSSSPHQKPLLLLFQKLLDEQIDESYFWNDYIPRGLKIIKLFKRYLNEKQKIELKELDRLYDGYQGISGSISNYSTNKIIFNEEQIKDFQLDENDVRQILCNFYTKSREIETLQMIFAEIIGKNSSPEKDNWIGFEENSIFFSKMKQPTIQQTVMSKQLLAIILSYEIESYCIKLTPLTNIVKRYSSTADFVIINYVALEKIVLEMKIQEEKYLPYFQQNFNELKDKEFSFSDIVQIIEGLSNNADTREKFISGQTYYPSRKS